MGYPQDDEYGRPVETSGEFARPENLNGHLVIVFPVGYHDYLPTKFTQPGKRSDALCCDIVDLDDKDENGHPGKLFRASNLMQSKLIVGLRPFIGKKVLGRIGRGVSTNGMNPPWVITDMSNDPVAIERAKAWKTANPNFATSPFIPRDAIADMGQPVAPAAPRPQPTGGYQGSAPQGYQADQYQAQEVQQAVPVGGSAQLTTEELNMLQKLRVERARREAEQHHALFQDEPPF